MQFLCKFLGGSHLYGLNTATSDEDFRGVYISTDPAYIVGLDNNKQNGFQENRQDGEDVFYFEFRRALSLLRGANTQLIEMLFNQRWLECSPVWREIQTNKYRLISSEKLYKCLLGYMQGELRLAMGERTGKLGGKRWEQLQRYGYSPKNMVQLFRLAWAGKNFFSQGVFPVHVGTYDATFAAHLLKIKTEPETFNREVLRARAHLFEAELTEAYNSRGMNYEFDEDYANQLCVNTYKRILNGEAL